MAPSFRETRKWNDAPDVGGLFLWVYVDPEKPFPEELRWLKDRPNRTVFNRGWVNGYILSDRTNFTEAIRELGYVARRVGR